MPLNAIFVSLYAVCGLAMFLMFIIGDILIKNARAKRIQQAKEARQEENLYSRYQKTRDAVERAARSQ